MIVTLSIDLKQKYHVIVHRGDTLNSLTSLSNFDPVLRSLPGFGMSIHSTVSRYFESVASSSNTSLVGWDVTRFISSGS